MKLKLDSKTQVEILVDMNYGKIVGKNILKYRINKIGNKGI